MSASISQKKRWGGARFDDRRDAHDGNHPVFCIPAAIPSSTPLILQNY
jgi:hypothetical protein